MAVLAEPLSIVEKAWEEAAAVQSRLPWGHDPRRLRVLVCGTGSLGSLAALLARLHGAATWALDRHGEGTAAARLLRSVDARHLGSRARPAAEAAKEVGGFDLVLETTGAQAVAESALEALAPNGCMALLGIPPPRSRPMRFPMERPVLRNQAILGSVNSSRVHFEAALRDLRRMERRWPGIGDRVVTSRYRPEECREALTESGPHIVKKVMDWPGTG